MLFSSPIFLFCYLPLLLLLYFLTPSKFKNFLLLIFSIFFYYWGSGHLVILLLFSIVSNYFFGVAIWKQKAAGKKKNILLFFAIFTNLSLLFYFKYANFAINEINKLFIKLEFAQMPEGNILLPLGISFFTFQALSYIIDLHAERISVQKNPIDFALYISLFPQLVAGPIVRYIDISNEIKERPLTLNNYYDGICRFIIGFGKKVIIADQLGSMADKIMLLGQDELSFSVAWLGIILFGLQIYYDFSGYSDMAIGLGRVFGFHFLENFNYPYISKSITEFWRRWHISLSTWFKDYLYIPLGGNRVSRWRNYSNLFIVFILCGIWHGASWNYLIWGLYHGLFLVSEKFFRNKTFFNFNPLIQHIYVFIVISTSWVFFRIEDFSHALFFLKKMIFIDFSSLTFSPALEYLNLELSIYLILAIIFSMPRKVIIKEKIFIPILTKGDRAIFDVVKIGVHLLIFSYAILLFAAGSYKTFIYFKF